MITNESARPDPAILPEWERPPAQLTLEDDAVHVWRAELDVPDAEVHQLRQALDPAEISRARRFHFEKDRSRFIVARGLLRTILGSYLNLDPQILRFGYGGQGKPFLMEIRDNANDASALRFNLSHSGGVALIAVTLNREPGIDLERIRPELATETIAEQFFSAQETAMLRALPADVQPEAFFNCWTRKEAYLKARADGLSFPLDQFSVSLIPGEPAALLSFLGEPDEIARWSLIHLNPGSDYVGALVVEGRRLRLRTFQLL
jgi:4'-phosphopantetheinyl transferase